MKVEQFNESLSDWQQERWGFNFIWDAAYLGVWQKFKWFASRKYSALVQEEVKLRCSSKPAALLALSKRTFYRDSSLVSTSKFPASWLKEKWDFWGLIHNKVNIQMLLRPSWTGECGRYPCPWQDSGNRWILRPLPTESILWFSVQVPMKDGAAGQLEVGCKLSYQTASPIFKARLIDHAQDQSPHLCSRRSQLISGRSSPPERSNLQGWVTTALHVLCKLRPSTAHCGCSQQTCMLHTDSLELNWVWTGGSGLLNPPICPCRRPMGAQHGRVSFPCCFAGSRDHHGCPADTTHWCYFNFRYFFSLHGGEKTNTRPFAPGEERLFV